MIWPFNRKPKPVIERINEDWRAGDLAECCMPGGWWNAYTGLKASGPEVGDVMRVMAVAPMATLIGEYWFLRLAGTWYHAGSFRKVPPASAEITGFIRSAARRGAKRPVEA